MAHEEGMQHFNLENLKGRDHFEELALDVRIILKWVLN
jgi:hypothetical protein